MNRILRASGIILIFLGACAPVPTQVQSSLPTAAETRTPSPQPQSVDELEEILEASDPSVPQYDPGSAAYAQFPEVVMELAALNASTNNAASTLAYAMGFPRADAYLAAQAVIGLGPEITATLLPILIDHLKDQRPEMRVYNVILLGFAGADARCSVGHIGPRLWDADAQVRSAAALALEKITGQDLVASGDEIAITPAFLANSVPADTPEGKIAGTARTWWTDQGSKVNWHPSYDLCDP